MHRLNIPLQRASAINTHCPRNESSPPPPHAHEQSTAVSRTETANPPKFRMISLCTSTYYFLPLGSRLNLILSRLSTYLCDELPTDQPTPGRHQLSAVYSRTQPPPPTRVPASEKKSKFSITEETEGNSEKKSEPRPLKSSPSVCLLHSKLPSECTIATSKTLPPAVLQRSSSLHTALHD